MLVVGFCLPPPNLDVQKARQFWSFMKAMAISHIALKHLLSLRNSYEIMLQS